MNATTSKQQTQRKPLTPTDIRQRARQFNATHTTTKYGKRSYYKVTGSQYGTVCIKHVFPTSAVAWCELVVERYRDGQMISSGVVV